MPLRSYTALFAATLLLASCAKEEVQETGKVMSFCLATDSMGLVLADGNTTTRAADGVNNDDSFVYPADFSIAVDGENYVYTASGKNTNMTSSFPAAFSVTGASVRVLAFYPSFKMSYSTAPQTFTVGYNQSQTSMGTANYRVSDLMYGLPKSDFAHLDGDGKVKPTEDPIPLVFEHMMVKIRIDVTTNGATVKQIKMANVQRSIDFNTADATFSNLATASDGFGDNVVMFDDATGTSTNFTCTALIPKQGLAADTQFIEVVIGASPSDLTLTYKLPSAASFDSGKQYIYNLAVSMDELEVSCEIDNWNAAPADPEFTQIKTI